MRIGSTEVGASNNNLRQMPGVKGELLLELYTQLSVAQKRGVSSNGTEDWNKIVIRRAFSGLRGQDQRVLPRISLELDI
jgi:hypothetical protein